MNFSRRDLRGAEFITKNKELKMTDLNKFFKALSERAYKENDLSDVTYSMCESNKVFRQFFLDFFFRSFNIDAQAVIITREYATEWGRPDFYIRRGDELFIVEVKIWDGSHHFEQYKEILDKQNEKYGKKEDNWERLGYIANYEQVKKLEIKKTENGKHVAAEELCPVYTWKDFVTELEKYHGFDDSAISAYVEYVKRVCPYDDFDLDCKELNLLDFKSVQDFENAVLNAIKEFEKYRFSPYYKSPRYFISQHRMGHFFEFDLSVKNEENENAPDTKRVWGWIGAYYRNKGAVVCVEFEDRDGWGKPVCDKFRGKVKDGCLRFYLTEVAVSDWKKTIPEFLSSVLECVVNGCNENISNDEKLRENAQDLLGMKILPCLLEQKFFAKHREYEVCINGNDKVRFTIEMSSGSDAEVPNSHCGRYFELKPIADDEKTTEFKSVRGWIGVMYSENKNIIIENKKNPASKNPTLIVEIAKSFADRMPGEKKWYDDDWGWKCKNVKIENGDMLDDVVKKIEWTIQSLFGQKSTIPSACSVGEN